MIKNIKGRVDTYMTHICRHQLSVENPAFTAIEVDLPKC